MWTQLRYRRGHGNGTWMQSVDVPRVKMISFDVERDSVTLESSSFPQYPKAYTGPVSTYGYDSYDTFMMIMSTLFMIPVLFLITVGVISILGTYVF